jgi:hypothetical protein
VSGASAASLQAAARAKQAVRERVWAVLERQRVARFPGATGQIPNLAGARRPPPGWPPCPPGRRVGVTELVPVDLVACGSGAVTREAPGWARAAASPTWSSPCWWRRA